MKNLVDILREKEMQLRQLEREVEALRIAMRLVGETAENSGSVNELSQPQMMRAVLLDHGKPMHINEIGNAIKKRFDKKIKNTYLAALVYRYIKRGKLFYKAEKPNTFGLLEWQIHTVSGSMPLLEARRTSVS